MHKSWKVFFAILILLLVFVVAGYLFYQKNYAKPEQVACTADAKLCPDGSYVGRTGANCEFASCPENNSKTKVYENNSYGFQFQYPDYYEISDIKTQQGFYDYEVTKIVEAKGANPNTKGAVFTVFADNAKENLDNCFKSGSGEQLTETKEINGQTFYVVYEDQGDAAMGGARGETSQYRALYNNFCYIIDMEVYWTIVGHTGVINTGVNSASPEEIAAQDQAVKEQNLELKQILSTFKFTK